MPLYGGFPVRLRTHVGRPIYPSDHCDVESLRRATVDAVEKLISANQPLPGSVVRAVQERLELIENPFSKHYNFVLEKVVGGLRRNFSS